jgi:tellurite resistance protein TerB
LQLVPLSHSRDGKLDIKERRSLLTLFQCFTGFSYADVESEFATHKRAFDEDPAAARHEAFATLRSFQANVVGAQLVLNACREILVADGIEHPQEVAELQKIRTVLFSALT